MHILGIDMEGNLLLTTVCYEPGHDTQVRAGTSLSCWPRTYYRALAGLLKPGHMGHAYLFPAPVAPGKTSVARILGTKLMFAVFGHTQRISLRLMPPKKQSQYR